MKLPSPITGLQKGVDFIGVTCVFVCHDGTGRILLGKRSKNCRDEHGRWDPGGGSMEFGENFEETIQREVTEEYRAAPQKIEFLNVRNVLRTHLGKPTHWIAVDFSVLLDPAETTIGEPDKIDEIGWFTKDTLPENLHSQMPAYIPMLVEHGILK